jgi:hypothetical protein
MHQNPIMQECEVSLPYKQESKNEPLVEVAQGQHQLHRMPLIEPMQKEKKQEQTEQTEDNNLICLIMDFYVKIVIKHLIVF